VLRGLVPAAAFLLVVSGCSNDRDYASPKALADTLAKEAPDLACEEYREPEAVAEGPAFAECHTASGKYLGLEGHEEADSVSNNVASADVILEGTTTSALVHGNRWIVYADDAATAQDVHQALGGTITAVGTRRG
jgi:hypothetical protein